MKGDTSREEQLGVGFDRKMGALELPFGAGGHDLDLRDCASGDSCREGLGELFRGACKDGPGAVVHGNDGANRGDHVSGHSVGSTFRTHGEVTTDANKSD